MIYALSTLSLLAGYLAYDAHHWRDGRVACPCCGEQSVFRVISCGLPGWFCDDCTSAGGLFCWADDLFRDPDSGLAGPFFNGELRPFGSWLEMPAAWWCWAAHSHDGPHP